jgi:hypothetical protein
VYPEAWFLPNANNIPGGFFKTGSFYDFFRTKAQGLFGQNWDPGTAVYQYLFWVYGELPNWPECGGF